MAQLNTVPQSEWRPFFDRLANALLGTRAEIEVASLDLGDQIVNEWIPIIGITYDRTDHLIRHPREIVVEEGPEGVASVAVVDADGTRQVVRLKMPLMLPPATM